MVALTVLQVILAFVNFGLGDNYLSQQSLIKARKSKFEEINQCPTWPLF